MNLINLQINMATCIYIYQCTKIGIALQVQRQYHHPNLYQNYEETKAQNKLEKISRKNAFYCPSTKPMSIA